MKGFTLLEVIVALVIAALAAGALAQAVGAGFHESRTASLYDQAVIRARSRLAAASHGTRLAPGEWSGQDGEFRWQLRVAAVETATLRPEAVGAPRAEAARSVVLYDISATEAWAEGAAARSVRLETQRVGG
jgi:general secretion pathway protein I